MKRPPSNSLRQELAKINGAELHPDDDILAAFAENSLLQTERERVMDHLSVCTGCREVLSLATAAMPEVMIQEQSHVLPVRRPLRGWLPWMAVAAGLAVVSSVVMLRERTARMNGPLGNAPASVASETPPPTIPPQPADQPQTQAKQALAPKPKQTRREATPQIQANGLKKAAPPAVEQASGNPTLGYTSLREDQKAAAPPAETQTSPVAAASAASPTEPESKVSQGKISAPAKSGPGLGISTGAATAQTVARPSAPAFSGTFGGAAGLSRASARTRWRINAEGRAERLSGYGQWQAVLTEEKAKMHVVSVFGDKVWLGGESLRLYSSDDNGTTWHSVLLPKKGGAPVITHIRFQSEKVGTVEADDGVRWSTEDGGLTWK